MKNLNDLIPVDRVIDVIDNVPEFPGAIPNELINRFNLMVDQKDINAFMEILRSAVRVTKKIGCKSIKGRGK